jgi:UDP-N-acetylglucosamine 2-epimerase
VLSILDDSEARLRTAGAAADLYGDGNAASRIARVLKDALAS